MIRPSRVTKNVNQVYEASTNLGDRLADGLARFGANWSFILLFAAIVALWMGINSLQLLVTPFDPYPYIFLNLVLSCLAAFQAPVILMSQNRQAARDRLEADHDYEVNVKAELEIEELHRKLDTLREDQWAELVRMQQRQIGFLEQLARERRGHVTDVPVSSSSANGDRRPRRRRAVAG